MGVAPVTNVENVTIDQETMNISVNLNQAFIAVDENDWEHGEVQELSCKNALFAVLFVSQLVVVITFSIMGLASVDSLLPSDISNHDNGSNDNVVDLSGVIFFTISLIGSVIGISMTTMLLLLGPLAQMMIQISLVVTPITTLLAAVSCLVFGQTALGVVLLVMCLIGVWYAVIVWHRIPFATANVKTAMAALKESKGLFLLSFVPVVLTVTWILVWAISVAQVTIHEQNWFYDCEEMDHEDMTDCPMSIRGKTIACVFLLSFYWTLQVIKNCFHTTIAGVVGTWWFKPQSERPKGFCNTSIYDSWVRSTIYSFGSICLGSFLVALLQVLQVIVNTLRNNNGSRNRADSILWCMLQFLVDTLEKVMEYFNKWAFGK